jgi:hypothetical protein
VSPARIKQFLDNKPFQPFTIQAGDGSMVNVLSREFAWLKPGNRTLVVSVPLTPRAKEEGQFEEHNIDVFLVTKVITPARRGRRRRAS